MEKQRELLIWQFPELLLLRGFNDMKRLVFLIGGAAALALGARAAWRSRLGAGLRHRQPMRPLALGACDNKNQDAVNNAELTQPPAEDLNALANDAAANAEDQALGNQQQQLDENAADDNGPNPTDAVENNVDAM